VAALYTRNNRPSRCHWLLLLLLPLPPPLPPPPTPPFLPSTPPAPPPPPPLGYALSSLSRARVSAHTRAPAGSIRARERTYTRRMHSGARVRVRVSGRRVHTRTAHARVSRFSSLSHVHIRRSEMREKESTRERRRERKRETLSPHCSRDDDDDGGGAQSFTDPLSPTRALSSPARARARAYAYRRMDTHTKYRHACRFDFPMQFFPSSETRAGLSPRTVPRRALSARFASRRRVFLLFSDARERDERMQRTKQPAPLKKKKRVREKILTLFLRFLLLLLLPFLLCLRSTQRANVRKRWNFGAAARSAKRPSRRWRHGGDVSERRRRALDGRDNDNRARY